MVLVRKEHKQEDFSVEDWLSRLALPNHTQQQAFAEIYHKVEQQCAINSAPVQYEPLLKQCREMVDILLGLNMDLDTLIAALIFPLMQSESLSASWVEQEFGEDIRQLLANLESVEAISTLHSSSNTTSTSQVDNLRKMLLSMAEDIRAVVIKLAAQVCF